MLVEFSPSKELKSLHGIMLFREFVDIKIEASFSKILSFNRDLGLRA